MAVKLIASCSSCINMKFILVLYAKSHTFDIYIESELVYK